MIRLESIKSSPFDIQLSIRQKAQSISERLERKLIGVKGNVGESTGIDRIKYVRRGGSRPEFLIGGVQTLTQKKQYRNFFSD